jgi:hypothetical protein
MKQNPDHAPIDWATRVNRTWIVRGHLNDQAEHWLEHLASLDDGRLRQSCENARAMCGLRAPLDDPKPWFYAGLFSLATPAEARTFLASHRVTKSLVPSMADDEEVRLWLDRVGPETHHLLDRLRQALARVYRDTGKDPG